MKSLTYYKYINRVFLKVCVFLQAFRKGTCFETPCIQGEGGPWVMKCCCYIRQFSSKTENDGPS